IASSTKISAAALEALERNDISKLPGGIFSRAFVRSYATEVGLDPDDTVREFLERFKQEPPPTHAVAAAIPEEEREFQERQRKAARVGLGAAGALGLLPAALVFAYRARIAPRGGAREPAGTGTAAEQLPPPFTAADIVLPAPPPAPASQLTLEIKPTADCWVSVTVDGKKVLARVVLAGEKQSFAVAKEAIVDVGDAGAFAYAINGKPGKPLGDKGQVRTLKVTSATAAQLTR